MRTLSDLERVLAAIRLCTHPVDGHTDPKSIDDCWNEVTDAIDNLKNALLQIASMHDLGEIKELVRKTLER